MASFILSASPIVGVTRFTDSRGEPVTMFSVAPMTVLARKVVESRNLGDVTAALDAFAAECAAMDKPLECSAYFPRQAARKVAGYDDAKRRGKLARLVNEGLAS